MDGFQCAEADSDILDIFDGIDLDTLFERYHIFVETYPGFQKLIFSTFHMHVFVLVFLIHFF